MFLFYWQVWQRGVPAARRAGTQFTCLTSTTVQILTPECRSSAVLGLLALLARTNTDTGVCRSGAACFLTS